MIFSKLLLINTLQRLETQTLGHYCSDIMIHWHLLFLPVVSLAELSDSLATEVPPR